MLQIITQGLQQGEMAVLAGTMSDKMLDRHQDMTTPPPRQNRNKKE